MNPPLTYGSLFSGVGGLDMGLDRAGFVCAWQCEIDAAAAGVLMLKWKNSSRPPRLFADVTAFRQFLESLSAHDLEPYRIDLVCGGSPCTNLSVAGLRAGLAGSESGLFREMARICRLLGPQLVLWENVVGAFSSCRGADFAEVIASFTGVPCAVPADGWGRAGFARGLAGLWHVAWRVLDAQHFGVPQRRRRVFLVGSAAPADGSCIEILFEPESVRGDSAPSGEAGQEVAPTIGARVKGGGGLGTDFDCDGGLVIETAPCLVTKKSGGCLGNDFELNGGLIPTLTAKMAKGTGGRSGEECQNLVLALREAETAHTLTGEGHDASEDGTGRGKPLVVQSLTKQCGQANDNDCGSGAPLIPTLACTLGGGSGARGYANSPDVANFVPVAFMQNQAGDVIAGEVMHSLATNGNATGRNSPNIAGQAIGVRRLTPVECERLMGWPDGHTAHSQPVMLGPDNQWHPKEKPVKEQADGPRYRQCGNGVVSACAFWIAARMMKFARFESAHLKSAHGKQWGEAGAGV